MSEQREHYVNAVFGLRDRNISEWTEGIVCQYCVWIEGPIKNPKKTRVGKEGLSKCFGGRGGGMGGGGCTVRAK